MTYITQARLRARAVYDFAVDGGAISSITLRGETIPQGAVIENTLIRVQTALTGVGASVALSSEGAADLQAVAAISGAPWSTTGAKHGSETATTAPITTTAQRSIVAVISAAVLTAGKFEVVVSYLIPQF